MKNKLDNFFKNKLDERELVFNEAHWEQAQFMLDKQEESNKRRAWWWYGLGGLLGLVLIGGLGWCWIMNDYVSPIGENQSLSIKEQFTKSAKKELNQKSKFDKTEVVKNETFTTTIVEDVDKLVMLKENKVLEIIDNEKTSLDNIHNKTNSYSATVYDKNKTTLELDLDFSLKNKINPTSVPQHKNEIDETIIKEINQLDGKNIILNNQIGSQLDRKNTISPRNSILETTESASGHHPKLGKEEVNIQIENRFEYIDKLGNELNLLESPSRTLEDLVPTMEVPTIKPITQKGWRLGITASVLMYPYSNSSAAQFSDFPDINPNVSAQHFTGFKIGASAEYHFNQYWALGAELLYYRQTGTFQSVKSSRQVQYRFGVSRTTFELVPQSLHYLEIPLFIQRKWNKHALEFGLATDFLLAVRNSIGTYQNTESTQPELDHEISTWAYKDGFAKLYFRGLLGYQYQVFNRLQVGLRMNTILGNGVLDKNYDAPFRFILLESRPINFELKMSYQF